MEHLVRSLKVAWKSEHLLRQNEFRLKMQKLQFVALAGLVAVFGLVMLSLAAFFALVPHWGNTLAAFTIGCMDVLLAGILIAYSSTLKPAKEIEMVKEVRDIALNDIEQEFTTAGAELSEMKEEVRRFIRNPVDSLLPGAIGPLISALSRNIGSKKNKQT